MCRPIASEPAPAPLEACAELTPSLHREGSAFLAALARGPVLADGAMGTLLLSRGVSADICLESLNLTQRALVESVHRDYIRAGAALIETNTYAANRYQLASWGLDDQVWAINVWGVKVARQAREVAGQPVFVAGAMGPLGRRLQPFGPLARDEARRAYREQAEALLAGGVDLFMIETAHDADEAVEALLAVREICHLPVAVQFSFTPEKVTPAGQTPASIMQRLNALDVKPDVVGVNCGAGPQILIDVLQDLQRACAFECFWSVLPNAGMPVKVGHRNSYQAIPEYFGRTVVTMVEAGARIVGGCCGTTPEHIRAMRQSLDRWLETRTGTHPAPARAVSDAGRLSAGPVVVPPQAAPWDVQEPAAPASQLAARLGQSFVISVELDPPKGTVPNKFVHAARLLESAGVDAINVADSPMARVRMSSLVGAHLLSREAGVETIMHFTTRDRNLMGIQSDLLGAHALGIRNVLALTGDSPALGNVTRATAVYDVDSIGLIHILNGLNRGIDVAGNAIGEPTSFAVGCALSPNADDLERELQRFRQKLAAGVHFVMTQPLYEIEPLHRVLDALGGCPVPILLGIMPLHSAKQAEYLHNEVPGISIPEHIRAELHRAGDDAMRVGFERAAQLIAEARPLIAGVYVVGSFGKYEPVADFVRTLRSAGYV